MFFVNHINQAVIRPFRGFNPDPSSQCLFSTVSFQRAEHDLVLQPTLDLKT